MMTSKIRWLTGVLLSLAFVAPTPESFAQPAQGAAGERQQSVQSTRYGTSLGLPKDADKLYLPDEAYARFPLPPGNEAYAHVDGRKLKKVVEDIAAISRKSRDDGNQYWGRIPGTAYDRMTADWVAEQFRSIGLVNVRRQELDMAPLWYPDSWQADLIVGGKSTALRTTFPINGTVGTRPDGVTAPAVWAGL